MMLLLSLRTIVAFLAIAATVAFAVDTCLEVPVKPKDVYFEELKLTVSDKTHVVYSAKLLDTSVEARYNRADWSWHLSGAGAKGGHTFHKIEFDVGTSLHSFKIANPGHCDGLNMADFNQIFAEDVKKIKWYYATPGA